MNFAKLKYCLILLSLFSLSPMLVAADEELSNVVDQPKWIWTPVQTVGQIPNGACYFRRIFDVSRLAKAKLHIAADDKFEVYVNGKLLGQGAGWEHLTQFDLSDHLTIGKNAIAVKVVNQTPGHAGLIARIELGRGNVVVTDRTWRTSPLYLAKWRLARFADHRWRPAAQLGLWNKTEPWIHRELIQQRVTRSTPEVEPADVEKEPNEFVKTKLPPTELVASNLEDTPALPVDDSHVVLAAASEEDSQDVAPAPQPLLLRPMEQTLPRVKTPAAEGRPVWSTDRRSKVPQEIRNPFVKRKREVETSTEVTSPAIDGPGTSSSAPSLSVESSPLIPEKSNTSAPASQAEVQVSPSEPQARFAPVSGFSVETIIEGDATGSLIAASFNEFGQMLVAREDGPLLICLDSNKDGKFDQVRTYCDLVKNCQGILALSGMAFVVGDGPEGKGLYRLSDEKRDGKLDSAKLLAGFEVTTQEHGPHGITLGPDGKLYVTCGNHTTLKQKFSKLSPRQHLYEGDLVPRYEDPGGHANGVRMPAGFVLRTDTDGKKVELFASGLRNAYDLAFNTDGELFIHDSDMESDMTTAWYRPTRVYHVPPGGEFGWRSGWAKWPEYYLDAVPAVADTGRGSPTGAIVYNHYAYPASFRGALFLGDWSEGKILVAKPTRQGATYSMETDTFLEGRPLNVTDLEIGPDGLLYFVTGGRGTVGGIFRVKWNGEPNREPARNGVLQALVAPQINSAWGRQRIASMQQEMGAAWNESLMAATRNPELSTDERLQALQLMQWVGPLPNAGLLLGLSDDSEPRIRKFAAYLMSASAGDERVPIRLVQMMGDENAMVRRQAAESLVRAHRSVPFEFVAPMLKSDDRAEAYAARLLLQLDHPDEWMQDALATEDPQIIMQASVALMAAWPSAKGGKVVIGRSLELMKGYLSDDDFIDVLRVIQLAYVRGELDADELPELKQALANEFPANHNVMNREMIRLMVALQVTSMKYRYLDHLESDLPESERIHLATHLRFLNAKWSIKDKFRLFAHLKPSVDAGNSVAGYMQNVARDFSKGWDAKEDAMVISQGAAAPSVALEAVMRLPKDLSEKQIRELVSLDRSVKSEDEVSKRLKVAILAVLARDGDESAMAHLRNVFDLEPSRRVECTIGLAEQPKGPNWPYLVKSLSLIDGEVAREVIRKLQEVDKTPSDSEAYRQVIMAGLRLGEDGGQDAVRLLERWRGFASTKNTPPWDQALVAWQGWFAKTYPAEPAAKLVQSDQAEKWDHKKLIEHLSKNSTLREASVTRGQQVFVKAQCAKCHQHGTVGDAMGPNLSTLGNRFHMKEIVESIIYPSKVISDQYKAKTLITDDGLTYTGIVGSGGVDTLLVLQSDGKKVRVPAEVVEQTVPSRISAMPEGLIDGLSLQEVTDLFAFLKQTPSAVAEKQSGDEVR